MAFLYKEIDEVPEILQSSKFSSIDGLRAMSIIIVLFGHLCHYYWGLRIIDLTLQGGGLGVNFFFVISGFLITSLLLKEHKKNGAINVKKFYLRRFFRIFPVAYLFIGFMFGLNYVLHLQIPGAYFLATLFYVSNIGGLIRHKDTIGNSLLIGHFWSLSLEEQYYIIYPIFFKFFLKYLPLLIISTIFLINIVMFSTSHIYFFYYFQGILIGSLCSFLVFRFGLKHKIIANCGFYQCLILLLILFISYSGITASILLTSSLFSLFIVLLLINTSPNIFFMVLNNKVVTYIGTLSYSIYIWQQIFTLHSPIKDQFPILNNLFVSLPILFLVSYISYEYYEKFFLRIKERFK
jgi:peptidoglycan/LPS O-acetylase OafA/YrhL